MAKKEQETPLAPSSGDHKTDQKPHRKKCIKCCICLMALNLIQIIAIILILVFTVFRIKDPIITMNGVTVTKLELINGTTPKPGVNMSLTADISVKNPNYASFKYSNTSTTLYYRGTVVGEARGPSGHARARRTTKMNITVDIITDRIMENPNLNSDINSEILTISSYSKIGGRVKILKIIKKHITVTIDCSITINITSRSIQKQKCKRHIDL